MTVKERLENDLESGKLSLIKRWHLYLLFIGAFIGIAGNVAQPLVWKTTVDSEIAGIKNRVTALEDQNRMTNRNIKTLINIAQTNNANIERLLKANGLDPVKVIEIEK